MYRIKRLVIFDFDWTLFRAPCSPDNSLEWWTSDASLNPPAVPLSPESDWWNASIVSDARHYCKSREDVCAIITGRTPNLCDRISDLLESIDIFPDYIFCYAGKKMTDPNNEVLSIRAYKLDMAEIVLRENPSIEHIIAYEDLEAQLEDYAELADQYGLKYTPIFVAERIVNKIPWGC